MRNLRLLIAYDGTNLAGWQRQANGETVQEELERAFAVLTGEKLTVHGSGRTDAGVHALCQNAHVHLAHPQPPTDRMHLALNSLLPPDIRVLRAMDMPAEFHARFSARGKRYLYRIRWSEVPSPIERRFSYWVPRVLDLDRMREAARHFVGEHDFVAMASNPGHAYVRPTVRRIQSIHLLRRKEGADLVVQGSGFLYNQVRTMAGSLVEVGRGRQSPGWISEVLDSRDRSQAGPTLPPQGLFLLRVLYPEEFGGNGGARERSFQPKQVSGPTTGQRL